VDIVDPRAKPLPAQTRPRPSGAFHGYRPGEASPVLQSEIERREQESVQLVENARRQAETIQRDAYHAGFEQGERAGEKLAAQKIEPVIQAFQTLLESVAQDRTRLIEEYHQELIKVAFTIATRVLHRTIEIAPESVGDVVDAALEKAGRAQQVTLQLSPHDRQLVEQQMRQRRGENWPPASITIQEEESLGRGGCRLSTEIGDIDATIEMQLRMFKTMLWEH